jgi:SPW repeat
MANVGMADEWWFWALAGAALAAATALSGRYRAVAARARSEAVRRGIVELPPGRSIVSTEAGFWSDLGWVALAAGLWVVAGPWTWGYDDVSGAIATDVVTGTAVLLLSLAAIVFPALWSLDVLAGLWLVLAPWLVGYGDAGGPVGLSDAIAGVVVSAVAIASLSASERRVRRGGGQAIGRIRPPR